MRTPSRRRIKKELEDLKQYRDDKQFSLAACGAEWALLWIYHGRKGFVPPTDLIKFGIEVRENLKSAPRSPVKRRPPRGRHEQR